MAYIGKTHLTFIFKADAANVAKSEFLATKCKRWHVIATRAPPTSTI